MPRKLIDIARLVGGELIGDGNIEISEIRGIEEANEGHIAFLLHAKFSKTLEATMASCVVVPQEIQKAKCAIIRTKNPSLAFVKLADYLLPDRIPHPKGIHKTAVIAKGASLGKNAGIGAYVVISDKAVVGDNTVIYPFCYIGHGTEIGSDSIIYTNVSIREKIKIGQRVIIHSGSVIGSDGFGYDNTTGSHIKIPQIGDVIIEDDVEIGAGVTIDRAKFAHTKIGKGTKIDNLVQIAHNVIIGENCILVAQCGIGGSSSLGKNVILAGQAGLTDHINLGDNVMAGGQSGVTKSFPSNSIIFGTPAKPLAARKKIIALENKLPEIYERLKELEDKVNKDKCRKQ